MKPLAPGLRQLAAASLLLCGTPIAWSQLATVDTRDTIQSGNFAVGYATLGDSGSALLNVTTADATYAHVLADSGSVNGLHGDTPVVGSGSFVSAQAYDVLADRVVFSGSAATTLSTPYSHVSAGANALSQLELLLTLPAPMVFELSGSVSELPGATVNGLTARADALVKLSGPGDSWLFGDAGAFHQTGVLAAGSWRINAFADTRGNGNAGFVGTLLLTPVPEPGSALLLAAGAAAMLARRRR